MTLVMILGSSCSLALPNLSIFAAAGAKPAINEICHKFQEKYGITVEASYGGGGEVLSQMMLSRSGDVYLAPEQRFMEMAAEKQAIDPETIRSVAYTIPVIGEMQVAISAYSQNEKSAQRFLDLITSAESKAAFKQMGYLVYNEEVKEYRPWNPH